MMMMRRLLLSSKSRVCRASKRKSQSGVTATALFIGTPKPLHRRFVHDPSVSVKWQDDDGEIVRRWLPEADLMNEVLLAGFEKEYKQKTKEHLEEGRAVLRKRPQPPPVVQTEKKSDRLLKYDDTEYKEEKRECNQWKVRLFLNHVGSTNSCSL